MFHVKKEQKNNLFNILKRFQIKNSDHFTKVNIFQQYLLAKNKKSFCKVQNFFFYLNLKKFIFKENWLNKKSLLKAI